MNTYSGQCASLHFTLEMYRFKIMKIHNLSIIKYYFQYWKQKINNSYNNSKIILTPLKVRGNSERDYLEQMDRIKNGLIHVWDDSKYNTAVVGDYFGYVVNQKKINNDEKTNGSIKLYKILEVRNPYERLSTWSDNVGHANRNVIVLSQKCYYEGTLKELKESVGYSPNYNVQGTMCINIGKSLSYFDKILDKIFR